MSPAQQALMRLLRSGERARSQAKSEAVSLPMTPAKCPEYTRLRTLSEIETFDAEIALAVRAGAVAVERERFGEHPRLLRLQLASLESLGVHLGVDLLSAQVMQATAQLADSVPAFPVVPDVLDAWARGRQVRGHGPEVARDIADAAKAVLACRGDDTQERLLRRESVRIFRDSKRLEALSPWLDLLLTSELAASGLDNAQIWSALGLRREPQPVLVAGQGLAILPQATIALCRPYLGLPVDAVRTIETQARYVLTIENLTSFHDAARALPNDDALLIYTGGMPSPAWRAFFARLLGSLPADCRLYHWGDIDEGGFRIAAQLATVANTDGRTVLPWLMSPLDFDIDALDAEAPSAACLNKMTYWADKAGWPQIASALQQRPIRIEQEAIDPRFP
ncbi:MAG: Wadjet anti-phage system protein JetD domain-containing protein [Lysobacteraceae bacterium]